MTVNERTRVYIAAPYGRAAFARSVSDFLFERGFAITSTWHTGGYFEPANEAVQDVKDLNAADVILVLSDPMKEGCATYWELGYAFAAGKPCYVIDQPKPYRCIFYYLPGIVKVRSVEEFVVRVKALEEVVA